MLPPLKKHVQTCYVFQNAGRLLGVDRDRLCTCNYEFGTQAKYEQARTMRNERKAHSQHSPKRPRNTGYRYLSPTEIAVWDSCVERCIEAKS